MALSQETRGVLTLVIGEIEKILESPKDKIFKLAMINQYLELCVKTNDLHPEDVKNLTIEQFAEKYDLQVAKKE